MNPKNIKVLAIIFIAFLLVVMAPWIKQKISPEKEISEKFENISLNFSDFSKENVEEITITTSEQEITLSLTNDVWKIDKADASPEKIDNFFRELSLSEIQKQSSKNKENHKKFEVDEESATTLTLKSNGEDEVFFIGKNGPSFDSFYARKKGVTSVFLISGNLKNSITGEKEDWIKSEETTDDRNSSNPDTLEIP